MNKFLSFLNNILCALLLCAGASVFAHEMHDDDSYESVYAYGTDSLSRVNDTLVRSVQREMGMADWDIEVLAMNSYAIACCGFDNAVSQICGDDKFLYFNEQWLNQLPMEQKRFIIGHELAHLKCRHQEKLYLLKKRYAYESDKEANELIDAILQAPDLLEVPAIRSMLCSILVAQECLAQASRKAEVEADLVAITLLHCRAGAIGLAMHMMNKEHHISGNTMKAKVAGKYDSHPTWHERLNNFRNANNYQVPPDVRVSHHGAHPRHLPV